MQTSSEIVKNDVIDKAILREGWTLHQRLSVAPVDGPLADHQVLESWQRIVAPDTRENFEKRLEWEGTDTVAATWCLTPDDDAIPKSQAWWPWLEGLREAGRCASGVGRELELANRASEQAFVHLWLPVAGWALNKLERQCGDLGQKLQVQPSVWLDLGENLLERLCTTTDQALWELFNKRRTPGQMLLAHLGHDGDGEPVREAYEAFVGEIRHDGYAELLSEYPVLGRLLALVTEYWFEGCEETLRRIAENRAGLEKSFSVSNEAQLASIQLGVSDPHRQGRGVAILRFVSSDQEWKVVYKPKDMQVDATYQRYLNAINSASSLPPLRALKVLTANGYGFMEWVEPEPCTSEDELARFYQNAGRIMAILHMLGCTDCHHENLIASRDQLILIDTETLLEADLQDVAHKAGEDIDMQNNLQESMKGSVLRTGLLPLWLMIGVGRKRAVDISALGIQPPPQQREMAGWLGLNSDGMMAGRTMQPCVRPTSLPVGLGSQQRLLDFVEQLCQGFSDQLQEVIRLKPLLQRRLNEFKGQPRRLVARATRIYFTIQRQMLEPGCLRSAVTHGLRLEQLCRSFVLAEEKPTNWPMLRAEILQMERLDIPFFEHLIDGDELPLPEGLEPIPNFMKKSGLSAAQERLQNLDSREIDFQLQLIRGAIAARHLNQIATGAKKETQENGDCGTAGADMHDYKQEANRLSEELWKDAIIDREGSPEWLGVDVGADAESFHFGIIGKSIYSGTSGIALSFARLAMAADSERAAIWRTRCRQSLNTLMGLSQANKQEQLFRFVRDLPYGLSGTGGILLALHLLEQAGITEARDCRVTFLQHIRTERLKLDQQIDVMAGVTGLIGPLLLNNTEESVEQAKVCGDRLLELQLENGGWPSGAVKNGRGHPPLTGFSHGAAGIAAALARLAHHTGNNRYAEAARRAVAYERLVYVASKQNWPDFRSSSKPDRFMVSWCHGAPGIMLSRHIIKAVGLHDQHTEDELEAARQSMREALQHVLERSGNATAHLCCGVFGITSLLRFDVEQSQQPLPDEVRLAESQLISAAARNGNYSLFSIDGGTVNLPGLLTGKAGVALALLEASGHQEWVPKVLSSGLHWVQ